MSQGNSWACRICMIRTQSFSGSRRWISSRRSKRFMRVIQGFLKGVVWGWIGGRGPSWVLRAASAGGLGPGLRGQGLAGGGYLCAGGADLLSAHAVRDRATLGEGSDPGGVVSVG